MRTRKWLAPIYAALPLLSVAFLTVGAAGAESMPAAQPSTCATVTLLEGAARLSESDAGGQPLAAGGVLSVGSILKTESASRVEITFTNGGIVRLAENTTVELGTDTSGSRFQVLLRGGEIWANLSHVLRDSPLDVLAAGAEFSGPSSVLRAIVFQEGSAEVKAYTGQITASGPFEIKKENGRYALHTAPGDEDSAIEPWQYQITPYRKVIVLPSGAATQPFRFAAKSDLTDWVRWNQQRDGGEK